ncbi:hypothetical protein AVEN_133793-1 [Araneus ventricosus]|uniref:Uncharacterized protein n=1 Tax=Araneus ventricosus TaxID=182803 RepID=A0A4Y2L126_ARAVE|nr:hypothetical protein AVEN_133793-1 [Araneus ventricosus]
MVVTKVKIKLRNACKSLCVKLDSSLCSVYRKWNSKGVKPAIHLKASHAICPKPVFSPIHFNRNLQARHLLEASKRAGAAALRSRLFPPTRLIFDFLASKRGPKLVRSFDVPPTLLRDLKLESAREVLEFDFVGIPAPPSLYANFHGFLKLTIAFSFPRSKKSS